MARFKLVEAFILIGMNQHAYYPPNIMTYTDLYTT